MAVKINGWTIQVVEPRDYLFGLMTVGEFIKQMASNDLATFNVKGGNPFAGVEAEVHNFQSALGAAQEHPAWDFRRGLRQEPLVGYNPATESHWYIFKMEHQGITLVVSAGGFPALAKDEL